MTRTRKTLVVMTVLLVIAGLAAWPAPVSARGPVEICGNGMDDDGDSAVDEQQCRTSETSSPTSGDGIVPELWNDNPNCEDLGYGYGFKINLAPNGTFTFTSANGELTGGAPSDPNNSVTIFGSNGLFFNWSSTLGIDAVFVKGGPEGGNLYIYDPEDKGDSGLSTPGAANDVSHIEFCYDYELTATKTANATYTRTYTWDITKSVAPDTHTGFAGDSFSSDYAVFVDQTVVDSDFGVSGGITVNNPTPFTVSFSVSDSAGGTAATVDCDPFTLGNQSSGTLAPGASTTCTYSASLGSKTDGTNTATITSNTAGVGGATASENYAFGDPTNTVGSPTINVTDDVQGPLGSASGDYTFEYSRDFSCSSNPADYTNGFDSDTYPNTATIEETGQSDDALVTVNCYAPVVTKDASTEWRKKYDWSITKSVDPDTHTGFAGDSFSSDYDVIVDQTITDYGFKAYGTIYVTNPAGAPGSMTVDVADAVNGTAATVDCGGGSTSLTVAAGATGTCSYTVNLPDNTDRTNTATVTFNTIDFLATAAVDFGDPIIEGSPTINVTDDVQGPLGSASGDYTFEYSRDFSCSSNTVDYTNGFDSDTYPNTATIEETGQSDDASVTVNCYALTVAKDASTSFKRTWTWTIDKSADQTDLLLSEGQLFQVSYEVTVNATSTDSDHTVSGNISVNNPAPIDAALNGVSDVVSPNIAANVSCSVTFPYTLAAGATLNCTYSADLPDASDRTNTATATLQNYDYDSDGIGTPSGSTGFSFSANVSFANATMTEVDECVDVSDTNDGVLGTVCAGDAPKTFTYSLWFGAHPEADVLLECGDNTHTNIASFETNDTGATGTDDWTVNANVACAEGCTLTPGYWKTHSKYGPAPYDDLWATNGQFNEDTPFFQSGKIYYEVLWTSPQGNAYYILAHAYIAAKLNILNGASSTSEVDMAITYAENFFSTHVPSDKLSKGDRNAAIVNAFTLDSYNNGLSGPGHCSE